MFSSRRKIATKGAPPPHSNSAALLAATQVYQPAHNERAASPISQAAAAAALRSASTRSPSPAQTIGSIPTKRMVKRRGSYSSSPPSRPGSVNSEVSRPATLRKPQSGSLKERTFRTSTGSISSPTSDTSSFTRTTPPRRSASAQDHHHPHRRHLSSPVSVPAIAIKTGENSIDEDAEFADTEVCYSQHRRHSITSHSSLSRITEEGGGGQRQPRGIGEEQQYRDHSNNGALKAALWAAQHQQEVQQQELRQMWGRNATRLAGKRGAEVGVGSGSGSGRDRGVIRPVGRGLDQSTGSRPVSRGLDQSAGSRPGSRAQDQSAGSRPVSRAQDHQAALSNLTGSGGEQSRKGPPLTPTFGTVGKPQPIYTNTDIPQRDKPIQVTTPTKQSSIIRLDTTTPPQSPSSRNRSPSKTTFPRERDEPDLSNAPPVPPLPPIATLSQGPENFERRLSIKREKEGRGNSGRHSRSTSMGSKRMISPPSTPRDRPSPPLVPKVASPVMSPPSSNDSQESVYLTPRSSLDDGRPQQEGQQSHEETQTKEDSSQHSGVYGAVTGAFNMLARNMMPGRFPETSSTATEMSRKSSAETLTDVPMSNTPSSARNQRKSSTPSPPATPITKATTIERTASPRSMRTAKSHQSFASDQRVDDDKADSRSLAGNSVYESTYEYHSESDSSDNDEGFLHRAGVHFSLNLTAYSPQYEREPRRWSSDSDSDDTVNNDVLPIRLTRPTPPRAPTPPTTNSSFAWAPDSPPQPVRYTPPTSPAVKLKPILKPSFQPSPFASTAGIRTEPPTMQRDESDSEDSVGSVSSYRRLHPRPPSGGLGMRATLRDRAGTRAPDRINTDVSPPRMASRKLRKETPTSNSVHLLGTLRDYPDPKKSKRKGSLFRKFTGDGKKNVELVREEHKQDERVEDVLSAEDQVSRILNNPPSSPSSPDTTKKRARPVSSISFRGSKTPLDPDPEDEAETPGNNDATEPNGTIATPTPHKPPVKRTGTLRKKRLSRNLDSEIPSAGEGAGIFSGDETEGVGPDGVLGRSGEKRERKKGFWGKVFKRKT